MYLLFKNQNNIRKHIFYQEHRKNTGADICYIKQYIYKLNSNFKAPKTLDSQ